MKKLITFLALIVLAGQGYAQYFPDTAWTRCYGGSGNDYGVYIQQTYDGGYIVLGRSTSINGDLSNAPTGAKSWVMKLDLAGDIEWQRYFTGHAKNIKQTTDSGYILGGANFHKLKSDGTDEWEMDIPGQSVIQCFDSGYAILNNRIMTKLSVDTLVEWTYNFDTFAFGIGYYPQSNIIQTSDSGFVIAGNYDDDFDIWMYGGWIAKADKYGHTVLCQQSAYGSTFFSVIETFDNGLAFTGTMGGYQWPAEAFWFKSNVIGNPKSLEYEFGLDITQNIDSSYIICGSTESGGNVTCDAFLNKRTPSGDSIVSRVFGGSRSDYFQTVIRTNDSGYIAIGSTNSNDGDVWGHHDSSDVWIVKFNRDTSAYIHPPIVTSVNKLSRINDVRVYPTITNGIVNVVLPQGYEQASIKAYSIMGQPVNVNSNSVGAKRTISIANQPAGQYILEVRLGAERKSFIITCQP